MSTGVEIRRATRADVAAMTALEAEIFDYSRMSRRSFVNAVTSPSAHCHVMVDNTSGALLGYSILFTRRGSRLWRLYSLALAPQARGRGLARQLLEYLLSYARTQGAAQLGLEVKCDNKAAIKLYEQLDFALIDVLPGYYDDGIDGYKMRRGL